FRVAAVNAIGEGAASLPSNAVLPLATAGPVAEFAVTPGNEQLTVTWSPPLDNGGATIADYEIEYKTAASGNWIRLSDGTNTALSVTIPNLTNGTNYAVRVRAVNSVGQGAWSESGPVMPVTGPGAPTSLVVSVDSGRASLSWTAPAGGGVPVNDYILQYRLASESTWITWNDAVTANPAATITGLTNGLTYVFRVKATTSAFPHDPVNPGTGDWAVSESRVIGPKAAAPLVAAAQKYGNGILLTWNRITPPAGFTVLTYQVEYFSAADGEWQVAGQADPRANSLLVDGAMLERGTYTLRVAAVTTVGVGNYRVSNAVTY
ncbi:MAG: fibronectin type III domain-containing protein, partial [Planctomycetia bacterium]|nr:fibronectin type III domain-containing protein [Planctomycetia bacterium]